MDNLFADLKTLYFDQMIARTKVRRYINTWFSNKSVNKELISNLTDILVTCSSSNSSFSKFTCSSSDSSFSKLSDLDTRAALALFDENCKYITDYDTLQKRIALYEKHGV